MGPPSRPREALEATGGQQSAVSDGSDQPDTLNDMTLSQIYAQINTVFEKALAGTAFAAAGVIHKSFQDKVKLDDSGARVPTAAFTVNGAAKVFSFARSV